ncbi:winged helix-turn-helix transcriptional regulator [Lactobacillus sp. Marseille-P7033]|nr:winged helix-turn-helix transcriptional regulator [Lactobacillus sp. Marseille-P7033]NGC78629.1 hypothetical protein [Limosilactobacillus reuteri]
MMDQENNQGIAYSLSFLRENDYPRALFWLGVKPLDFKDLQELLTGISSNRLITIIEDLQEKYIISPIQEAGCFVLTTGGEELARIVTALGVWGRQQMDEYNGEDSDQVVLPDSSMEQKELLSYRNVIGRYV